MGCKVVVGNFLDDDLAFAISGDFDPDFDVSFVHDGPGKMAIRYKENADPGNPNLDFSLNLVKAAAANWTAVAGTITDSADQDHGSDATSKKVLDNLAEIWSEEYALRSGYSYWLEGWAFGSGAGPTGKISLYNRDTKRWWNGSAWVDSIAYLATSAAAAWVGIGSGDGVRVDVEDRSETLGATTRVVVQLWRIDNSTADPVYFDDVFLYAGVNFIGLLGGHNIPAWVPVTWQRLTSTGAAAGTSTFTKAPNQFYLAPDDLVFAYEHIIKFDIGGTTIDPPFWFGDCVVGQVRTIPNGPEDPVSISYEEKGQTRLQGPGGTEYVSNRGPAPPRTVSFGMTFRSAAEVEEARAILIDELRGGEQPCVVLPEDVQLPELVVYGRISQPLEFRLSPRAGNLPQGAGQEQYARASLTFLEGAYFQLDD